MNKLLFSIIAIVIIGGVGYAIFQKDESNYASGIRGVVLLGPQCPVVREGEECPDKPYATKLAVTTPDGARVVKEFSSLADGSFSVDLPLGEYAIRSAAVANVFPYCSADVFRVVSGAYTDVSVSCDTGIR